MRIVAIIFGVLIFKLGWAQNLVPNPSFEEKDTCPITNGALFLAQPWTAVNIGASYFHECGANGFAAPSNKYGWENPRTGEAYIGFSEWVINPAYESQFAGVELISPLIAGKKYNVVFYVSMMDSSWYAIKNIAVYFSQSQPPSNITTLLSYEPQVKYTGSEFLDNKEGWTKIEGSFFADGEEQFITIGNFDGHDNTDTLFVSGGGEPPPGLPHYWKVAAYYIDDVSVELDTTTGIEENERVTFNVYPNPVIDFVTIETEQIREATTLEINDVTGRVINSISLNAAKTTVDLSFLSSGIYTATLFQNSVVVSRKQIVKTGAGK